MLAGLFALLFGGVLAAAGGGGGGSSSSSSATPSLLRTPPPMDDDPDTADPIDTTDDPDSPAPSARTVLEPVAADTTEIPVTPSASEAPPLLVETPAPAPQPVSVPEPASQTPDPQPQAAPTPDPEPTPEPPQAASTPEPTQPAPEPPPEPEPEPEPAPPQATPTPAPEPESPIIADAPTAPDLPASAYALDWGGLTAEEQLIVELVNRARMDPTGEIGRQDGEGFAEGVTAAPKEALAVVSTLTQAARDHSEDMDNRDYFAHTNLDGESPADRAVEAGHSTRFVGENLGWVGSTRTTFDQQDRAEFHHAGLWESDGHQQNLMSDRWSEIGVGYDYGDYRGYTGSTFVTEKFSDTGKTYLTGVVIEDDDGDDFYDMGEGQGGVRITAEGSDGTLYATSTWDAGGYTLELPPGTYTVTFEGGDMDMPYQTTVTIGDENVKLDVTDPGSGAQLALSSAPEEDSVESDFLPMIPMPEDDPDAVPPEEDEPTAGLLFG